MADVELVKKMLRAVLQANKGGLSLSRLQSEYKELTGEQIPHKQMGYNHLDALLASMPSLIRIERTRSGEVCLTIILIVILMKVEYKNIYYGASETIVHPKDIGALLASLACVGSLADIGLHLLPSLYAATVFSLGGH